MSEYVYPKDWYPNVLVLRERLVRRVCRIEELEATIKRVEAVGYEADKSWGSGPEFEAGWNECRKQVGEAIKEQTP